MNGRQQTLQLRLEMLRLRGQIERTEVAAAAADLRVPTGRIRSLGAVLGSVATASSGAGGWLGLLGGVLSGRPWLAALAVRTLRTARRHPWLAAACVVAALVVTRWYRRAGPAAPAPDASAAFGTDPVTTSHAAGSNAGAGAGDPPKP